MPLELQARLVQLGFKTADAFAMLDDDVAGVRKFVKDEVKLKAEGNPEYRAQTATVLAAWKAARERGQKRRANEAYQRTHDLPRKLPNNTHQQLIMAYNEAHPKRPLTAARTPAQCYLETTLD